MKSIAKTLRSALCASLFALCAIAPAGAQGTYYVSASTGNDTWTGLLSAPNGGPTDGPFATLAKAQTMMRATQIKKTTVRAGTYSLAANWEFTEADNNQTWVGYPGETATIGGGGVRYVSLGGVNNLRFFRLTFNATGGTDLYNSSFSPAGIYLGGASNVIIRWNNFTNCVQACITGDGGPTNNLLDSNTFNGQTPGDHAGTENFYSAVMLWYGATGNRVTHNSFANIDGGAVVFATGVSDPPANNNVIDRNIATTVCNSVTDCGAFYIFDGSHSVAGNQMTNNVVTGNGGAGYLTNWTKAYYLDDLMSNITVSGNVCRNCGTFAFQIHAGDHVTVTNNIFDLSQSGAKLSEYDKSPIADFGMASNSVTKNLIYSATTFPSTYWLVDKNPGDALPAMNNNLYFSANSSSIPNVDVVDANRTLADPQFTNAANGDYSMPGNSPAYTAVGFTALATNQGPLPVFIEGISTGVGMGIGGF